MDSDDEEEKEKSKGSKFPIQMYISEGNKHLRLAKYDTAIGFFNAALEKEPNNVNSFIGRSKCKMRLAKFTEAREDAEAALKINPKSSEAKILIGEADYFLGDFEKSFLSFYRGHSARPNCGSLRLGHQMCRRAIDNALQPDKRMIIGNHDVDSLSDLEDKQGPEQISHLKTKRDSLSADVCFVETLLNDNNLDSIHPHCEYLLTYLRERQVFWRTQNPNSTEVRGTDTGSNATEQKDEDDSNTARSVELEADKNNQNIIISGEMQAENVASHTEDENNQNFIKSGEMQAEKAASNSEDENNLNIIKPGGIQAEKVASHTEDENNPNIIKSGEMQAQKSAFNSEDENNPNITKSKEMQAESVASNTKSEDDPNVAKSGEMKAENVASNAEKEGQDETASSGQAEKDTK